MSIAEDFRTTCSRLAATLDKDLCFVCGVMKSGTTWVQLLLDAHPQVRCRGEGHLSNVLLKELDQLTTNYRKYIHEKNRTIFREIEGFPLIEQDDVDFISRAVVGLLLSRYDGIGDVKVIAEKTPDNLRELETLKRLFPRARFIHVVRDGRDVAVSGWHHNLRISPAWTRQKFAGIDAYARGMAKNWARQIGLAERFMAKYPDAMIEVRYEDLLSDPVGASGRMFRFLGVDHARGIVETCCRAASFEAMSGGRPAGSENRRSHFRKGTSEQWRDELSERALRNFQAIAGKALQRHRYEGS